MDWGTIGLVSSLGLFGYYYWKTNQKVEKKNIETVQELLAYKHMTDDGLVQLENGTFAIVLEAHPINVKTKSQVEKDGIWINFRTAINELACPITLLVQSQYLDMGEYIEDYSNRIENTNLTQELNETLTGVSKHLYGYTERKTRDYSAYIIVRFNPYTYGAESGVETGNVTVDKLMKKLHQQKEALDEEEAFTLAEDMLDEVGDILYQSFDPIGIKLYRLDKLGVHHMIYTTLNRDLALHQKIHEVNNFGSFTELKQSLTPHLTQENEKELRKEIS